MGILEFVLVILVSVWTVIFVLIALVVLIILIAIRKGLKRADKILEETEDVARRIDLPSKIVVASIMAFLAKSSIRSLRDLVAFVLPKGRKKK